MVKRQKAGVCPALLSWHHSGRQIGSQGSFSAICLAYPVTQVTQGIWSGLQV